jgi:methylornithine synthase
MYSDMSGTSLESILESAEATASLSNAEIMRLLAIVKPYEKQALFAAARRVRAGQTDNKVFLYGFLYLSTFCRNNCSFCFYRSSNTYSIRYRKNHEEIVDAARKLADTGVHLIDLTMGEDPVFFSHSGFDGLAELVASVVEVTDLPVMVSPGLVDDEVLEMLERAGASWYACYQETHNRSLFEEIRPGQDFDKRWDAKKTARGLGLLTEEGILSGIGESRADVVLSLQAMSELCTDQVRVMSFVPQRGTPLETHPPADPFEELKIIAIMRLLFPDRLIPASLDIGGLQGLKERLNAGANVVTSLVPPGEGLAGVAQSSLDIEDALRTVACVEPVVRECGLVPASTAEYRRWVNARIASMGSVTKC